MVQVWPVGRLSWLQDVGQGLSAHAAEQEPVERVGGRVFGQLLAEHVARQFAQLRAQPAFVGQERGS